VYHKIAIDYYHVTADSNGVTTVVTGLQEEDPTLLGSSVFGISDIYNKWKRFVLQRRETNDSRLLYLYIICLLSNTNTKTLGTFPLLYNDTKQG